VFSHCPVIAQSLPSPFRVLELPTWSVCGTRHTSLPVALSATVAGILDTRSQRMHADSADVQAAYASQCMHADNAGSHTPQDRALTRRVASGTGSLGTRFWVDFARLQASTLRGRCLQDITRTQHVDQHDTTHSARTKTIHSATLALSLILVLQRSQCKLVTHWSKHRWTLPLIPNSACSSSHMFRMFHRLTMCDNLMRLPRHKLPACIIPAAPSCPCATAGA
jgi:hypothetical protein